jgi:outer membrane biosynthesis protein TonB
VHRERGSFRRALELSLLLHLLLVFLIVPTLVQHVGCPAPSETVVALPVDTGPERPLQFEFVDLAEEREEPPRQDRPVPFSDMDRRAHGGDGEASDRPASRGNTPQIVQADGGTRLDVGAPPQPVGPQTVPVPQPEQRPEPEIERPQPEPRVEPEGAGEERPETRPQQPALRLPPPGQWALPPEQGGERTNPNRRGGQVDTGGLSFDTQWYDWGPYAKRMLAKIRRNWRIPEIARLGVSGVCRIRFFIERDGSVSGLTIMNESGKPPMDFAARDAIAFSNPFDPLPTDLTGVDREGVTITFYYNLHPPDRDGR